MNAACAADEVVIVAEPALFSAQGVAKLVETLDVAKRYYNPELHTAGVIVNRKQNSNRSRAWESDFRTSPYLQESGIRVFPSAIPERTGIQTSTESATSLRDHPQKDDYTPLAEILTNYLYLIVEGEGQK